MAITSLQSGSGGTNSLKSTPNNRFFWETFHCNFYLLIDFLPDICLEESDLLKIFNLKFKQWPGVLFFDTLPTRLRRLNGTDQSQKETNHIKVNITMSREWNSPLRIISACNSRVFEFTLLVVKRQTLRRIFGICAFAEYLFMLKKIYTAKSQCILFWCLAWKFESVHFLLQKMW